MRISSTSRWTAIRSPLARFRSWNVRWTRTRAMRDSPRTMLSSSIRRCRDRISRVIDDVDPNLARASTLPSSVYFGQETLARENARVFGRTWQLVGSEEDVAEPGRYFTATIAGEPIL